MKLTKTILYLALLFLLAVLLRLLFAYYTDIGTDEMIYTVLPYNIISAQRLSTLEQAPLYFYLVDLGYKLTGGHSLVAGRLPSILFGSLSALLIFLIAQQLFQNKAGALLSAFLWAISGYGLRYNQEMDPTAYFFALLSMYFFLRFLQGERKMLYAAAVFLALGIIVKPIILLFTPAYVMVWLFWSRPATRLLSRKENQFVLNKGMVKSLSLALLLSLLVVSPVLIYNTLLYQEKGITDYYFTLLLGVGNKDLFQGQEPNPWTFSRMLGTTKQTFQIVARYDPVIAIMGILGLVMALRRKNKERQKNYEANGEAAQQGAMLLILSIAFLFLYLGGRMGSSTHYLWLPLALSVLAGEGMSTLAQYRQKKFKKYILVGLLLVAVISLAFTISKTIPLRESSIAIALNDYAQKNIPNDAIVVVDPRIYRGILAWALPEHHYLEGNYFPPLVDAIKQSSEPQYQRPFYYIECGPGTFCGWKPEDFQRIYHFSEQLSAMFHAQTEPVGKITAIDTFLIYRGDISAPESAYETIDRTHQFWYAPVGWKFTEDVVDTYTPTPFLRKTVNSLGFLILYADVAIALLSLPLVFFLLGRRSD